MTGDMDMAKGKLIVLEGIDGSGKSSQYRRICQRFERRFEDGWDETSFHRQQQEFTSASYSNRICLLKKLFL